MDGTWDGLQRPGFMSKPEMPCTTEYDMRWKSSRDFSMSIDYGDAILGNSWTAERVIRPSLHRSTAVSIRLRIQGKRRAGKLRAHRWYGEVLVGQSTASRSLRSYQRTHACNSIADAERKADAWLELGDFDEAIEQAIRDAYSPLSAESWFRWDQPKPTYEDDNPYGRWAPFLTWFRISYMDPLHLPRGSYFATKWLIPVSGPAYLTGREVRVDGLSASSTGGKMQDDAAQDVGTWIPEPRLPELDASSLTI